MIIARVMKTQIIYGDYVLKGNREYVMSQAVLDHLNKLYPRSASRVSDIGSMYSPISYSQLKGGEKLLIFRSGGIGDVLFMTPLIRFIKETKGCVIKVATMPIYVSILQGNPYIDEVLTMPFLAKHFEESDFQLTFEGVIEDLGNRDAENFHAVDLFLKTGGIAPSDVDWEKKIPIINLDATERVWAERYVQQASGDRKKIGVQITSSSPIRSFPLERLVDIIVELISLDYTVFILGGSNQIQEAEKIEGAINSKRVINLPDKKLSLRQSIALTEQFDLVIAPDSSFIHIAGALGVPILGLYGCFPSPVRMRYYKNAIGIDCGVACAPSFVHGHLSCMKGSPSPCFSVISDKNIMDAVEHLIGTRKIQLEYPEYYEYINGNPIIVDL